MKQPTGTPREVTPTALRQTLGGLRLCTPEEQQEMERSLRRLGQLQAVLVYGAAGGWEVIDGFKRVRAARALAWTTIRIEALEVDAAGAKVRLWQSNAGQGMTELEEAWLIRSLHREEGWTQVEIARWFGRHKSWVNRRLLLAEGLADEVQADVRLGLLSVAAARELGRLPRGNQAEVAAAVARHGLTSRQAAGLVDAWLDATIPRSRPRCWPRRCGPRRAAGARGVAGRRWPARASWPMPSGCGRRARACRYACTSARWPVMAPRWPPTCAPRSRTCGRCWPR